MAKPKPDRSAPDLSPAVQADLLRILADVTGNKSTWNRRTPKRKKSK